CSILETSPNHRGSSLLLNSVLAKRIYSFQDHGLPPVQRKRKEKRVLVGDRSMLMGRVFGRRRARRRMGSRTVGRPRERSWGRRSRDRRICPRRFPCSR